MIKGGYTYILASKRNGTLYTGVSSRLDERVLEHHTLVPKSFTGRYHVNRLVWYERHDTIEAAIVREKQIKKWNRAWKIELIEKENPDWNDLAQELELV